MTGPESLVITQVTATDNTILDYATALAHLVIAKPSVTNITKKVHTLSFCCQLKLSCFFAWDGAESWIITRITWSQSLEYIYANIRSEHTVIDDFLRNIFSCWQTTAGRPQRGANPNPNFHLETPIMKNFKHLNLPGVCIYRLAKIPTDTNPEIC